MGLIHAPLVGLFVALAGASPSASSAPPEDGRELIASRGCAACHGDLSPAGLRAAPDLRKTVAGQDASFLERYLREPHVAQPGARMPDLLADLEEGERARAARELVAFLRGKAEPVAFELDEDGGDDAAAAKRGERLFHSVGCVMCHGPRDGRAKATKDASDWRSLEHVPDKYEAAGLAAFLLEPLEHRPGGLMPDMHLSRNEASDLARYLVPGASRQAAGAVEKGLALAGEERFRALGCASCHRGLIDDVPASVPARGNATGGCLAETRAAGVPDHGLTAPEREALRALVEQLDAPRTDEQRIADTLGTFRCTSCHERGEGTGVRAELDHYLTTDEPDLGEPARRPPHLNGVGGKLRRPWLERVLYDGASVRPYMHARMPMFGEANLAHLPGLLETVDAEPELTFPKLEGDARREARDGAREMLGTTSLGCVTCHNFNGKPAPSFKGMDLITAPERLRERWFKDFLVSPGSRIPGIVMPESWPGGVAVHDTMLGGDTDRQIAAIWDYLTLGTSARDPRGISQPRWNIDVEGAPRVYRGRSRVAGFRGVAVGFPEGLHYAFDANNGAFAALWRGDFVSVNWNGQGAGDFNPRSRAAELARDIGVLVEHGPDAPWPLRPVTTKEEPVNPDPTYPRQHGYRFRGYRLDADGVPTLRYMLGGMLVEDRSAPVEGAVKGAVKGDGAVRLARTLTFDTEAATTVTTRVLTGAIEDLGDGRFRVERVTLSIGAAAPRLRPLGEGRELLLDLELPAGRTALELIYDLAD